MTQTTTWTIRDWDTHIVAPIPPANRVSPRAVHLAHTYSRALAEALSGQRPLKQFMALFPSTRYCSSQRALRRITRPVRLLKVHTTGTDAHTVEVVAHLQLGNGVSLAAVMRLKQSTFDRWECTYLDLIWPNGYDDYI